MRPFVGDSKHSAWRAWDIWQWIWLVIPPYRREHDRHRWLVLCIIRAASRNIRGHRAIVTSITHTWRHGYSTYGIPIWTICFLRSLCLSWLNTILIGLVYCPSTYFYDITVCLFICLSDNLSEIFFFFIKAWKFKLRLKWDIQFQK